MAVEAALAEGVDPSFALAVCWRESRLTDPPDGANVGPMQVNLQTWPEVARANTVERTRFGVHLLAVDLERARGDKAKAERIYRYGH